MAYEKAVTYQNTANIYSEVKAAPDVPAVSGVLRDLAEATHALAAASESFVHARNVLGEAQAHYSKLLDVVAKEREQAGV